MTDITINQDEGGYWEGTERRQNAEFLSASMKRQSVIDIQSTHNDELKSMRERFPDARVHDLVRFLKARDFNVPKAISMYEAHLQWRKDTLPIPKEKVEKLLETRKFYMLDELDEDGRPIIFYCLRRFKEKPYVVEDEIEAMVYMMENNVVPRHGPSFETQKGTVLIDVSGIRSPPLSFLKKMNVVMEANYPETLFRLVMFPVPYWLQKIIQGCLVFVDEETRSKFAYVNDVKLLQEFANTSLDNMGPDVQELIDSKNLKT